MWYRCKSCGKQVTLGCLPTATCSVYMFIVLPTIATLLLAALSALTLGRFLHLWTLALVPVCVLLAFPLAPVVDWILRQFEWCGVKFLACPDCGSHDWSKGYTSGFGM